MSNKEVFDLNDALERVNGDKEFLVMLFDSFLERYDGYLLSICNAVEKESSDDLKKSAHTMKGVLASLSAVSAASSALKIELLGRSGKIEGATDLIKNLSDEVDTFKKEISSLKAAWVNAYSDSQKSGSK